jgi:hypothetical protein
MSEWKENTGVVPEGVTASTTIEVKYADGWKLRWPANDKYCANDDPGLWLLEGNSTDVIRWRFVDAQ